MSRYHKKIRSEIVDVYDVLQAFEVVNPAVQHAIKKLLMPGARGAKCMRTDLEEANQSIMRAIQMVDEAAEADEDADRRNYPVGCTCVSITHDNPECPIHSQVAVALHVDPIRHVEDDRPIEIIDTGEVT